VVVTEAPPRQQGIGPFRRPGDVLVPLAVAFIQIMGTIGASQNQTAHRDLDALAFALLGVGPVLLFARRRAPVLVLVGVLAATLLYDLREYPHGPIFLSLIVAFFTVVTMGRRTAAVVMLAVGYSSFMWLGWAIGVSGAPSLGEMLGVGAWLLVLLAVSEGVRTRRERALEAWRSREEEARRRASEERLRIARELHDVLAHNISLINVQAGVALHLMDEQPEQARTALAAIKEASKDALGELRSVLDVLRQAGEAPPRSPTAGLADLDGLVAGAEAAGLTVRTRTEGTPRPLAPSVDLAGYRIVQEALTNVTRHAGPATATVRIAYGDNDVTVEVLDDGRGTAATGLGGGGNGIPGMRERAAALGGELEAGPRDGGGFAVRARLPAGDRP
jgi:signal transduction histidine kinase